MRFLCKLLLIVGIPAISSMLFELHAPSYAAGCVFMLGIMVIDMVFDK